LFPPNLEHSNSSGRLDLFALYGPIINHHSVDYCFSSANGCQAPGKCIAMAKLQLNHAIAEKQAVEMRKKMGATSVGGIS